MKKNIALKWEKAKAKGQARVVSNFKKKWIPFVLEFAQANLKKATVEQKVSFRKGLLFLSSPSAERYDKEGFDVAWENGLYQDAELDLTQAQTELKKMLKYWHRKDLKDPPDSPMIVHHVRTLSGLYIDHGRFSIEHILYNAPTMDQILDLLPEFKEKGKLIAAKRSIKSADEIEMLFSDLEAKIGEMAYSSISSRYIQSAIFLFRNLLDGLPLSSIKTCKGCGHYFLHLSQRDRAFCTPLCAGRSIQEGKREKLKTNHPRKHKQFLLEQRFRMGELRKGPREYAAYLKKNDRDDWESYKQWRKFREKIVRHRAKKRGKKISVKVL